MRKIKVPPYNYLVYLAFGEEELRTILKKQKINTVVDTDSNLGFVMPLEDINGVELCLRTARSGPPARGAGLLCRPRPSNV